MKASDIYLKAAELCGAPDSNLASCWAIALARSCYAPYSRTAEGAAYAKLFRPDEDELLGDCWLVYSNKITSEEWQPWRVLALLFMHQIALDEEGHQ